MGEEGGWLGRGGEVSAAPVEQLGPASDWGLWASWALPSRAKTSGQPMGVLLCPPQGKDFPPLHPPLSHLLPTRNPWCQGPTLGWLGCCPFTQASEVARQVATKKRQESGRNGECPGLLVRSWAAGLWTPQTVTQGGVRGQGFVLTFTQSMGTPSPWDQQPYWGPGLCGCFLARNLHGFPESLWVPVSRILCVCECWGDAWVVTAPNQHTAFSFGLSLVDVLLSQGLQFWAACEFSYVFSWARSQQVSIVQTPAPSDRLPRVSVLNKLKSLIGLVFKAKDQKMY